MATIEEIIAKYIELRDRKAALAKKQAEEMAPLSKAQEDIENYLMHQMNTLGVDSLKANGVGTAFKATSTSCQMADPMQFKAFVFAPAIDGMVNYLQATGHALTGSDRERILTILRDMPLWDMVDFRAGKKGVTEYVDTEQQPVPGITLNKTATVSIRRA